MKVISNIKRLVLFLKDPASFFKRKEKQSLDELLGTYLPLLIVESLLAGLFMFLLNFIKTVIYGFFYKAEINYLGALNYSFGFAASAFFLYLFIGTFGIFFIIAIISQFSKRRLVDMIKKTIICMSPVILFGWITILLPGLIIWTIFLYFSYD